MSVAVRVVGQQGYHPLLANQQRFHPLLANQQGQAPLLANQQGNHPLLANQQGHPPPSQPTRAPPPPSQPTAEPPPSEATLVAPPPQHEWLRLKIVRMIIKGELPFIFVKKEGFVEIMQEASPSFKMSCRKSILSDCLKLFIEGKEDIKSFLTLHKKIINFQRIYSHKGVDIADAVARCLEEWNLTNIFTVTGDNATANDTAIQHLKEKAYEWGTNMLQGKYMHIRCVAHVTNLIVCEGLTEVGLSVRRVLALGSRYVTSHLFFEEILKIFSHIRDMQICGDDSISSMADKMLEKVAKYWDEQEDINLKLNRLCYIANVFDPRHKFKFGKYAFTTLYGAERAAILLGS
ncbi:Putative AC transposase [Linum perenne]